MGTAATCVKAPRLTAVSLCPKPVSAVIPTMASRLRGPRDRLAINTQIGSGEAPTSDTEQLAPVPRRYATALSKDITAPSHGPWWQVIITAAGCTAKGDLVGRIVGFHIHGHAHRMLLRSCCNLPGADGRSGVYSNYEFV